MLPRWGSRPWWPTAFAVPPTRAEARIPLSIAEVILRRIVAAHRGMPTPTHPKTASPAETKPQAWRIAPSRPFERLSISRENKSITPNTTSLNRTGQDTADRKRCRGSTTCWSFSRTTARIACTRAGDQNRKDRGAAGMRGTTRTAMGACRTSTFLCLDAWATHQGGLARDSFLCCAGSRPRRLCHTTRSAEQAYMTRTEIGPTAASPSPRSKVCAGLRRFAVFCCKRRGVQRHRQAQWHRREIFLK